MDKRVIVIIGPTASGKSTLAIEVAKRLNGVIISADSMQIYRGLNVGTAKVTTDEMQKIEHLMIDICDITEKFDVAMYKEMCYECIDKVLIQGKTPIIVGGTGLYINAIINNVEFSDECKDEALQSYVKKLEDTKTAKQLYDYLCMLDAESAKLVDKGNKRRIARAIYLKLIGSSKKENDQRSDLWKNNNAKYDFLTVYIDMPRSLLYDRIEKRVDNMVQDGILEEAQVLYNLENKEGNTACQAIGYKEFFDFFKGEKSLDECTELLKLNTRHYAKRQITWFKKLDNKINIDGTKPLELLVEQIVREYYENKT